jgi:hypothetical protein
MGIRYLAVSISEVEFDRLSADPTAARLDDEPEDEDQALDLDKSWGYLQRYLAESGPRPAAELVAGDVTHTDRGWISHRGLLSPSRVESVAADLSTITQAQLQTFFGVSETEGTERDMEDYCYVSSCLARAVEFTAEVAASGRGIVYWIG